MRLRFLGRFCHRRPELCARFRDRLSYFAGRSIDIAGMNLYPARQLIRVGSHIFLDAARHRWQDGRQTSNQS